MGFSAGYQPARRLKIMLPLGCAKMEMGDRNSLPLVKQQRCRDSWQASIDPEASTLALAFGEGPLFAMFSGSNAEEVY